MTSSTPAKPLKLVRQSVEDHADQIKVAALYVRSNQNHAADWYWKVEDGMGRLPLGAGKLSCLSCLAVGGKRLRLGQRARARDHGTLMGFRHINPGNRTKSRSFVWTSA